LGAAVNVLLGASPVPLPGVPETQASRFGAVLGAGVPFVGGMKSLKALATGEEAAGQAAKGIKAYHGSPHEFEKFAMEKIGTGEGAQAYGHGLYVAENEDVARVYRDALARDALLTPKGERLVPPEGTIDDMALAWLKSNDLPGLNPYQEARRQVRELAPMEHRQAIIEKLHDWQDAGYTPSTAGHMYEVNIKADPEHFLDWDKPLSEQSPAIQQVVKGVRDTFRERVSVVPGRTKNNWLIKVDDQTVGASNTEAQAWKNAEAMIGDMTSPEFTGREAYQAIARAKAKPGAFPEIGVPDPAAAAAALREVGIPGIKYLDQASRAAGEGTRNYVIFDDALIDILRKYGFLPPVVGGTLGLSQLARPSQPQGQQ
jgi:hypothetical protein